MGNFLPPPLSFSLKLIHQLLWNWIKNTSFPLDPKPGSWSILDYLILTITLWYECLGSNSALKEIWRLSDLFRPMAPLGKNCSSDVGLPSPDVSPQCQLQPRAMQNRHMQKAFWEDLTLLWSQSIVKASWDAWRGISVAWFSWISIFLSSYLFSS